MDGLSQSYRFGVGGKKSLNSELHCFQLAKVWKICSSKEVSKYARRSASKIYRRVYGALLWDAVLYIIERRATRLKTQRSLCKFWRWKKARKTAIKRGLWLGTRLRYWNKLMLTYFWTETRTWWALLDFWGLVARRHSKQPNNQQTRAMWKLEDSHGVMDPWQKWIVNRHQ